jgi:recombination protein RecR
MIEIPSKLIESAVREIAKLPGIGRKTALRLILHLLKEDEATTHSLTDALNNLRDNIKYCEECHNISDSSVCNICGSKRRDHSIICVVEDIPDVLAIENTSQYQGLYHVLGGIISPVEGIGPSELNISTLVSRIENSNGGIQEIIFALSPTMEGDTTAFYISRKLKSLQVKISSIARGVPIGGNLEYADEVTLGRSIVSRISYEVKE